MTGPGGKALTLLGGAVQVPPALHGAVTVTCCGAVPIVTVTGPSPAVQVPEGL